ncbi:hypothetical protein O988_04862 [Pseudogymnoascus sp. VKM F-3808]|nr:hypothetical protein O988_04862 [Pseudogymnoascus sp. VKM F-3808]
MARLSILTLFALISLFSLALALSSDDLCTYDDFQSTYKKPFMPWFRGWKNLTSGPGGDDEGFVNNMGCWWYADCIFSLAAETRKQQYGAVSIVMALIPVTLKDIAWPHRRMVPVPKQLNVMAEILIKALGLVPVIHKDKSKKLEMKTFGRFASTLISMLLVLFLVAAYGILVVMEFYSKRSSLGCPVPAFVAIWFVIALAPAAVEVAFSRFTEKDKDSSEAFDKASESGNNEAVLSGNTDEHNSTPVADNIQGGDQNWFVQICWGFYYSAGSLIFTSIMLVSVVELFSWVILSGVATAASKLLAYRIAGYWGVEDKNVTKDTKV